MEKEEAKIREDIHKMMVKSKVEHGILSKRLVEIDQLDKTLVELEQDLLTLRKHGRKAPDRKTRFVEPETPPRDIIKTVVNELGICSNHLSTVYTVARPTHEGIEYLDYTIRVSQKYIYNICEKYHSIKNSRYRNDLLYCSLI